MNIQEALRDYWLSQGDKALTSLAVSKKKLECIIEHGVGKNPFLFFSLATVLDEAGLKVDKFSDLPLPHREAIARLLFEKVTVEDYLAVTGWSRDTFLRYLKLSPGASRFATSAIDVANKKLEVKRGNIAGSQVMPEKQTEQTKQSYRLVANLILVAAANAASLEDLLEDFIKSSTEKDRINLRDALSGSGFTLFAASNAIHRLSQRLNPLCSEKAFGNYKTN